MHTRSPLALTILFALAASLPLGAQTPSGQELGVKFMRDSEEYATIARQIYRLAGDTVSRFTASGVSQPWAVVLDVDETVLDNSAYQLERAAYQLPYTEATWAPWVERREAAAIPGAGAFVQHVRQAGGKVAWITNRDAKLTDATRDNLRRVGLWNDEDRLCPQKEPAHTKAMRRREVVSGQGDCAWQGMPARVAAFVGDQLGDFPSRDEAMPGSDEDFGRTSFLLPNSMYGGWITNVTRIFGPLR